MELLSFIKNRVSIRNFSDEPVNLEALKRILEAGRLAPSAKNRQPWRFIVIREKELRSRVQNASFGQNHVGTAPVIIAACTTNVDYRMPNGQLSYPIDISFAVSSMMLQIEAEGLGSCVVTTFDEREMKDVLSIPYLMKVVMLLLVGHSQEKPLPTEKKAFDQVISFDHW
ncbi:MAG: nitroreductase family protein [Spirochaetales bacterium]|nr:nitroreductase family protein [Spirochaetales bacterium]